MERRTLPLVLGPRPLIPGTRLSFHTPERIPPGSERVVMARRGAPGSVATEALIDHCADADSGGSYLSLIGLGLVHIVGASDGAWPARVEVVSVDEEVTEAGDLIAAAQQALRRYHARSAEAGERADVTVSLSPDPVRASHEVASYLRISAPEIQELLEAGDAGSRLARSAQILDRESDLLARMLGRKGD